MSQLIAVPRPRLELRRAIFESGLPAWKVGHLAGVSATVLSYITTGRRAPRAQEAERLSAVLGRPIDELFPELEPEGETGAT